jgi:phospholipid transport system substrate-binding protein
MARLRSISFWTLVISVVAAVPGQGALTTPMETVRESNEAISAILDEYDPLGPEGEELVYGVMDGVTDFSQMSAAAIDDVCVDHEVEADRCGEWKTVFGDLLRIRSIKGVGRYRADRFEYLNEEIDGERAVVNTLAYYEDEEVTLDYELESHDGSWLIVNYVLDDVDTVRSYRRRFGRLLDDNTVDEVIARLRNRIEEFREDS